MTGTLNPVVREMLNVEDVDVLASDVHGWYAVRFPDDPNLVLVHRAGWDPQDWMTWTVKDVLGFRYDLRHAIYPDDDSVVDLTIVTDGVERTETERGAVTLELLDALIPTWLRGLNRESAFVGLDMRENVQLLMWMDGTLGV
ncbi:Uncharacterised protein [Mycobacteroides abscessus subsp. abscessus]|uniref:hypothetical protein n=1 Tax=Mycobacteroides abscessus TaxID=36809 RepID=UPI0009A60E15|nr:hypothetical protein [Mycobacteroides abscessus]SKV12269.1 Uncharacterised protein [Mycobacteroides abscessus subsp. abscessus]